MTERKCIPVEEIFAEWEKNPAYVAAQKALEEELALAEALIRARTRAGLTQVELAARMGTTQPAIARLEGGRIKPTTKTLERFAEATGTRLKITFEPAA